MALFLKFVESCGCPSNGGPIDLEQGHRLFNIFLGQLAGNVKCFQLVLEFAHDPSFLPDLITQRS